MNGYSYIAVTGQDTITLDSTNSTLTVVGTNGISVTTDDSTNTLTFATGGNIANLTVTNSVNVNPATTGAINNTVIGATTQDEYRNTILKNAALARRFNEVKVNAPSPEDTFKILQGIRDLYEKHHNVILPDEVLTKSGFSLSVFHLPQSGHLPIQDPEPYPHSLQIKNAIRLHFFDGLNSK